MILFGIKSVVSIISTMIWWKTTNFAINACKHVPSFNANPFLTVFQSKNKLIKVSTKCCWVIVYSKRVLGYSSKKDTFCDNEWTRRWNKKHNSDSFYLNIILRIMTEWMRENVKLWKCVAPLKILKQFHVHQKRFVDTIKSKAESCRLST